MQQMKRERTIKMKLKKPTKIPVQTNTITLYFFTLLYQCLDKMQLVDTKFKFP
jgi:hypothetical protein